MLSSSTRWFADKSGAHWHGEVSPDLCLCFHMAFSPCASVPKSPLLVKTPVLLDWRSTLLQCDLILTNYICNEPISK